MSFTRLVGLLSETTDQIPKQRYATAYYELASPKILEHNGHTCTLPQTRTNKCEIVDTRIAMVYAGGCAGGSLLAFYF